MALVPTFVRSDVRVRYSLVWDKAQTMPGGATYETSQEATRAAFHFVRAVIVANHSRSGALAKSMRTDMSKRGTRNVVGLVRSNVEHAKFFFYGTGGRETIHYKTDGSGYELHDPPGYVPVVRSAKYAKEIRGQESNMALLEKGAAVGVARVSAGSRIPRGVRVRF